MNRRASTIAGVLALLVAAAAGAQTATTSVTVRLDKTPPIVTIAAPTDASSSPAPSVTVAGTVSPGGSPTSTVTCNGAAAALTADAWTCAVTLAPSGPTTITVAAMDAAGNAGSAAVHVTYQPPAPTITATVTPAPNAAGWNRTDTTVTFTCTNASSCSPPVTVTNEGIQEVTGTASSNSVQIPEPPVPVPLPGTGVRVQESNLAYVGSFRLPDIFPDADGFAYPNRGLVFNPANRSLFVVGKAGVAPTKVGEISIPTPGTSTTLDGLPRATVIQRPADVSDGKYYSIDPASALNTGGLLIYHDRLIASYYANYDDQLPNQTSHVRSGLNVATVGDAEGPFEIGIPRTWPDNRGIMNRGFVSSYMALTPADWLGRLGGPCLGGNTGINIIGRTSWGPSLYAFDCERLGPTPAPAVPLMFFTADHPLHENNSLDYGYAKDPNAQNSFSSLWNANTEIGGAVPVLGTNTILFFGNHGDQFSYGKGTSDPSLDGKPWPEDPVKVYCYDDDGNQGVGIHSSHHVFMVWAFDLNDLAAVKSGAKQPWSPRPYATWELRFPVGSPSPHHLLGATYDPAAKRVYLLQGFGDLNGMPLIHVFELRGL